MTARVPSAARIGLCVGLPFAAATWIGLLLGVALAAPQREGDGSHGGTDPGPRQRVGGLLALQARSEVHFHVPEGLPAPAPHQIVVTFAFPDRARWRLEPSAGRPGGRRIVYRFGASAWVLEPDQARSRPVAGEESADLLGVLELRRALLLWPHGVAWKGLGRERRAELPEGRTLVAHLDPGGERPGSIECLDPGGKLLGRFAGVEWTQREGRTWPGRFDFELEGGPVWSEDLAEIELDVRHVDAFFQPHDARPAAPVGAARPALLVEVARQRIRRVDLPVACDWTAAQERFSGLLAEESARLAPLTLDGSLRVEVDPNGAPVALLLLLVGDPTPELPEGYRIESAGSALSLLVDDPLEIDATLLRELARGLPQGATAAWPARARMRPAGSPGPRAQVWLPLIP